MLFSIIRFVIVELLSPINSHKRINDFLNRVRNNPNALSDYFAYNFGGPSLFTCLFQPQMNG